MVIADEIVSFAEPPGLAVESVAAGRLNGVFAAPQGARHLPAIILLHGSEGGGAESARRLATRFAGQGYAAFALNWFAYDVARLPGVPNKHVNQPIELIDQVRAWLARRPEVDAGRIGVYGQSKGAEYALVAASHYRWIKAVIGCVPTDVVWEGYGIGDQRNAPEPDYVAPKEISSWSWQGKPLPYVPTPPWVKGQWFDNTERYEKGRHDNPDRARVAAIPIERTDARLLLLGSLRDETWASGVMAGRLAARMAQAGKGARVETMVYEKAGHQICGDGVYPTYIWADPSDDPRVKDPAAEGHAAVDAWHRMIAFLKSAL